MDDLEFEPELDLSEVTQRDQELFEEVCKSFADLYRVSVKILSEEGVILIDVPGNTDFCGWIYNIAQCRKGCLNTVGMIRKASPSFRTMQEIVCFSGAEYRIAPIHHETDVIGKVIFGPFLPSQLQAPPPDFLAMDEEIDPDIAWSELNKFRRLHPDLAAKVTLNIATVIECMAFIGFKGQLTTGMHVESITEAYAQLEIKNKEIESRFEELRILNEQRSAFLSTISGELKAPLTSIIGHSEMLIEGVAGDVTVDQEEFLNTIMSEGETAIEVAERMEELAEIEQGRLVISKIPVSIGDVVASAFELGKKLAKQHDVTVELTPWDESIPDLFVDPEKTRSILNQLIGNAIKFTPAGGTVTLSVVAETVNNPETNHQRQLVAISVKDTGIGIAKRYVSRLFEPFFRIERDSKRTYAGSGVGLAIAKAYIDAHGGRIRVKTAQGVGSTFIVILPAVPTS